MIRKKEMKSCPKCKSGKIKLVDYSGIKCIICSKCGHDEREVYEQYPEERTSQKAKARYTPYKSGGGHRTMKNKEVKR
jgi:Zn ribbon nucleic-acid-binding protein